MKLQIAFDFTDLEKSLDIAQKIIPYASILEIGSLLLFKEGIRAIEQFRKAFPGKVLLADTKIVDRAKPVVQAIGSAGANWVTVMAGAGKHVIHTTCATAHSMNMQVMLDLLDACSLGQSALDAKNLGVNALLFHKSYEEEEALTLLDNWQMVRGNTSLPIFIAGKITKDLIPKIKEINPDGLVIGRPVLDSANPADEIKSFFDELT
jgi:3-hexulose-6-phosphate synthase/6-phospho-3-hexuloisomerase